MKKFFAVASLFAAVTGFSCHSQPKEDLNAQTTCHIDLNGLGGMQATVFLSRTFFKYSCDGNGDLVVENVPNGDPSPGPNVTYREILDSCKTKQFGDGPLYGDLPCLKGKPVPVV